MTKIVKHPGDRETSSRVGAVVPMEDMANHIQPALDGMPDPDPTPARRKVEDYETWVAEVRPTFEKVAATGRPFLCWQVARDHNLPDPPDRDHDWGRLMARLHHDHLIRTDGFGLTRDKSGVRRWRGTRAAQQGRAA